MLTTYKNINKNHIDFGVFMYIKKAKNKATLSTPYMYTNSNSFGKCQKLNPLEGRLMKFNVDNKLLSNKYPIMPSQKRLAGIISLPAICRFGVLVATTR
jgi:ATP-dependent helicase/DNAse subunit B